MKILVTGSRDWDDFLVIEHTLRLINPDMGREHLLIQGGARGVDQMAFDVGHINRWSVHTERADWTTGRMAGPMRNQRMVDMKPDICVVFRRNKSRGATDCGTRAEAAGIKTYWIEYEDLDS